MPCAQIIHNQFKDWNKVITSDPWSSELKLANFITSDPWSSELKLTNFYYVPLDLMFML